MKTKKAMTQDPNKVNKPDVIDDSEVIRSDVKLRFSRSKPYFGKGTVMLLNEIDNCGSVRKACENCGFSYSKGWTILNRCEKGLGYRVVERHQGGETGGTAKVTETGHRLLQVFTELNNEVSEYTEKRFLEEMKKNGLL